MSKVYQRGNWRQIARAERHNGNTNEHNMPTVDVEADWEPLGGPYPCEHLTTAGGEMVRGRQVTSQTTHLLIGDYYAARRYRAEDRVQIDGQTLNIVAVRDPTGLKRVMWIECKEEV